MLQCVCVCVHVHTYLYADRNKETKQRKAACDGSITTLFLGGFRLVEQLVHEERNSSPTFSSKDSSRPDAAVDPKLRLTKC